MAIDRFDLGGRIALVTGSGRGIGLAIARGLAEAGAEIVLNGRNAEQLETARAGLAAEGYKAHAVVFDVVDRDAVTEAVEHIESDIGPIDILFNNAGMNRRAPLAEYSEDAWREVMSTNLDGVFRVGQIVARNMIPRKRGKIINTCSLASDIVRPNIGPYAASKGAVKMLTKAMCAEWAQHNIQANAIGPGFFKTEMNRQLFTDQTFDEWVRKRTPAARWGELDELVGIAIFLASKGSSYVNGQIFYIDGGLSSVT